MPLSQLQNSNFANQTVLLSIEADTTLLSDANSSSQQPYWAAFLPTLQFLLQRKAAILLLNSRDPRSQPADGDQRLARFLEEQLQITIPCIADLSEVGSRQGQKAQLIAGKVALLESSLYPSREQGSISQFAGQLTNLVDLHVCESPSLCLHQAEMIAKLAEGRPAYAGLQLIRTVEFLESLRSSHNRPLALIAGGVNLKKKMELIQALLSKMDTLLIGGGVAYTFLKSRAIPIGNSFYEDELEIPAFQLIEKIEMQEIRLLLPTDHLVSQQLGGSRGSKTAKQIPDRWIATDIGKKSAAHFGKALRKAATLLWYGPMGMIETERDRQGTISLAKDIGRLPIRAAAMGQSTVEQISLAGCSSHFEALIAESEFATQLLMGKPLSGLEALRSASGRSMQ